MTLAIDTRCLATAAPDRRTAACRPARADITGRRRTRGTGAPNIPQIAPNDTTDPAALPTDNSATAASDAPIGEPDATFPIAPPR